MLLPDRGWSSSSNDSFEAEVEARVDLRSNESRRKLNFGLLNVDDVLEIGVDGDDSDVIVDVAVVDCLET